MYDDCSCGGSGGGKPNIGLFCVFMTAFAACLLGGVVLLGLRFLILQARPAAELAPTPRQVTPAPGK
jgi:hypothetical protein